MNYIQQRQNVIQVSDEILNAKLLALVNLFSEKWLNANEDHPLQRLWNRKDVLATNELLNFSHAIELLQRENPGWLRSKVRTIKAGNAGEAAGALFEIIALGLFSRQTCKVIPAPGVTPGFDGTLKLADGAQVLLSIKNHGMSSRETEFVREAKDLDAEIQRLSKAESIRDIDVTVLAMRHLGKSDFENLKADMAVCLAEIKTGGTGYGVDRPYQIVIKNLSDQYESLSPFFPSSVCRIISPISKNEQVNFEDSIRKGCDNLYSQTKGTQENEICRVILLRLSNSASATLCCEWAEWYFAEYPQDPIDLIILYQPAVVTDVAASTSTIVHNIVSVAGPRFQNWRVKPDGSVRSLPSINFLIGAVSTTLSPMILSNGEISINLDKHYIYQRGDIYQRSIFVEGVTNTLYNPVSGIMLHSVLEEDDEFIMTLTSVSERYKELILLP